MEPNQKNKIVFLFVLLPGRWQPKIQQLISQLDNIADKHAITTLKKTQPNEFHLTVPNPRAILIPEQIPRQEKTKPVSSVFFCTKKKSLIGF